MQNNLKNYISSSTLENDLNNAYNNILNFDKTIASAVSILLTNFINDKIIILNFLFLCIFLLFVHI